MSRAMLDRGTDPHPSDSAGTLPPVDRANQGDVASSNADMRRAFEQLRRDLVVRFGWMMIGWVSVVLLAWRYLPRYRW